VSLLDPASFGAQEQRLAGVLAALADLGVPNRVVQGGMQFEHLVPLTYRGIQQFRVGATGRAIPIAKPAVAS
jgi:hypothetical protein